MSAEDGESVRISNCGVETLETSLLPNGTFAAKPGQHEIKVICNDIETFEGSILPREIKLKGELKKGTLCAQCLGPTEEGKACIFRQLH